MSVRCPECGSVLDAGHVDGPAGPPVFECRAFDDPRWNYFTFRWATRAYLIVRRELGPYDREPVPVIVRASDKNFTEHGFTGSHLNGQIALHQSLQGDPGKTLRVLTHELLHASLEKFPNTDPFYYEGFADYATQTLAELGDWAEHREAMRKAASQYLQFRGSQVRLCRCEYDAKRWSGALFAENAYGQNICSMLKAAKAVQPRSWWLARDPGESQHCPGPYHSCALRS